MNECSNPLLSVFYFVMLLTTLLSDYIIPIPGAPPAGIAGASSLIVDTTDSVVRSVEATLVAILKSTSC